MFQDRFRPLGRHLLNIHAARSRCHEDRLALAAIHQDAQVKFLLDRQRLFDQQAMHDAPFRSGLMRDQFHAQNLVGDFARFLHRLGELHSTALAATAGVNLRLHHNSRGAGAEKFARGRLSFFA